MANQAVRWQPMHVECVDENDFEPEVRIASGKTRTLTILEVIKLSYFRTKTYNNFWIRDTK